MSKSGNPVDLIIVGQGLAGSALAWQAWWRGSRPLLVDASEKPGATASRVAAGLLNPVTGRKPKLSWRVGEFAPFARSHYRRVADETGETCFHESPIIRFFADPEAADAALADPALASWLTPAPASPPPDPDAPRASSCIGIQGGGWLDTGTYLDATRAFFSGHGLFLREPFSVSDVVARPGRRVRWHSWEAGNVIIAAGYAARLLPPFRSLPFRPAAGSILEVALSHPTPPAILSAGGKWLLRRADGRHLAGASYEFLDPSAPSAPTLAIPPSPPEDLVRFLDQLAGDSGWQLRAIRRGIRPILRQSRPLAGRHPRHPWMAWLNGLGSKGVLTAPWAAASLIDHLLDGHPIDPEIDASLVPHVQQLLS